MRSAGEAAVGNQRDVFSESCSHDSGGGREHLRHPGTAFRSFVSDHDHIALLNFFPLQRMQHVFFGIVNLRRTRKA